MTIANPDRQTYPHYTPANIDTLLEAVEALAVGDRHDFTTVADDYVVLYPLNPDYPNTAAAQYSKEHGDALGRVSRFYVMRHSGTPGKRVYSLNRITYPSLGRNRWGNYAEISTDLRHAVETGSLPAPARERW